MSLYDTGVMPYFEKYVREESEKVRDYGDYWSASSAGYCMRLNILKRLKVPKVPEIAETSEESQMVFQAGHMFHWWLQNITKESGLSIAQELELQDEDLLVRGHIDDLVLVTRTDRDPGGSVDVEEPHLILYDYKTANSSSFVYKMNSPMGYYHKMQLGTYLYMLRRKEKSNDGYGFNEFVYLTKELSEARILTIDKNSFMAWTPELKLHEVALFWTPALEKKVVQYWKTLEGYWKSKTLPACTCHLHDGGFMARRSKKGRIYNDYFFNETPCSNEWIEQFKDNQLKGWTL